MSFSTFQDSSPQEENHEPDAAESQAEFAPAPKKVSIPPETLGLGCVLLLCAGVVACMYWRNMQPAAGAVNPFVGTISSFLGQQDEHLPAMCVALRDTDQVVDKFKLYPSRTQVPLADLHTNPFRQTTSGPVLVQEDSETVSRRKLEQARAEATAAAQALTLVSVMRGPTDACIINNQLYLQGQQVNGFDIEAIRSDSVVVRHGRFRFELKMKQ